MSEQIDERFMSKVEKAEECWLWTGARQGPGYGKLKRNGENRYAHRFAYEMFKGEIPDGKQVNHRCHNESCVNPEHLYLGTQEENVSDAIGRGTFEQQNISGTEHGSSKLDPEKVRRIRRLYEEDEMTQYELAEEYDVQRSTIQAVVQYETWAHVGVDGP